MELLTTLIDWLKRCLRVSVRAGWVVAATGLLAGLGIAAARAADEWITVRPHDTGGALVNPDMGWTLQFYSNDPTELRLEAGAIRHGG